MKAVFSEARGGPESLRLRDVPEPAPGPGQLLVRVEAAGVNFADAMMRLGLYPGSPDPPHPLGFEGSGMVEAAGDGVTRFAPGDRVMGLIDTGTSGGYAEKALMPEDRAMALPPALTFEEGAAFPVVFLTAYGCLRLCGGIEAGQSVLIHAAGGGVGTAAVQLARRWGATVFATAGSDDKLARVRELGADHTINYRTDDFAARVREATSDRGVDLVLDSVGGEVFDQSLRLLTSLGRLVTYGIASRTPNALSTSSLLFHSWAVLGFHMSALGSRPGLFRSCTDELLKLLEEGAIRPIVGHRFALADAAGAHRLVESRASYGKIVLVPGQVWIAA